MGSLLTIKLARRNHGISEPEHTLYLFVLPMVLVPFALILYGVGEAQHGESLPARRAFIRLTDSNPQCIGLA